MLPRDHRARSLSLLKTQMEIQDARRKADQAVEAQKRDAQMRQIFQQYGAGIVNGDENALAEIAKLDPAAAQEFRAKATTNAKANLDMDETRRKAAEDKLADLRKSLIGVEAVGPESRGLFWKQERKRLERNGFDVSDVPEEYDANWVKQATAQVTTFEQQLAAQRQDPEYIRRRAEAEREPIDDAARRAGAVAAAEREPIEDSIRRTEGEAEARARAEAKYRRPTEADRSIVTVQMPDGTKRSFRATDKALDKALADGAVEITKPSGDFTGGVETEPVPTGAFDPATGPSDPRLTTGFWGPATAAANAVTDFLGLEPFSPEAMKAAQELKQLDIETTTMLQEAIPGRPSNYLMQELKGMVAQAGGGGGPAGMMQKLTLTRQYLQKVAGQVQAFKPQTKAQADKKAQNLLRLKGLVQAYDQMIAAGGGAAGGPARGNSEEDALIQKWTKPSGGRAMDEQLTPEMRERSTKVGSY